MLAAQDRIEVQHELLARLDQARAETDRLFDHVKPEFLYERPIPERHRIVFYIGHLEAFDWNLLRETRSGTDQFPFGIRQPVCIWHRPGRRRIALRPALRLAFSRAGA